MWQRTRKKLLDGHLFRIDSDKYPEYQQDLSNLYIHLLNHYNNKEKTSILEKILNSLND